MKMNLIEMEGLLHGNGIPGDMKVNESNASYLVRKFSELEAKCAALAAENAELKRNIEGTAEFCYSEFPETPATDAFLAEVRASAVDEVCLKISNAIVNCYQDEQIGLDAAATICGDFAAQLRQEAVR